MADLDDLDLRGPGEDEPLPPAAPPDPLLPRAVWGLIGVGALVALGAGGYLILRSRPPVMSPVAGPSAAPLESPSPSPVDTRPLDDSDAAVRELARGLSSHPAFASWLIADGLVRRLAAAVASVAEGESPHAPLEFLAPHAGFAVVQRRGRLVIDRGSYARYDEVVDVVSTLDAQACAKAYRRLEPLLDAALAELGQPGGHFAATLDQAIRLLLETPLPDSDPEVRAAARPGPVYEYVDPGLEDLTPAQKHLLRLGPDNARRLKAKLRELAEALREPGPPGSPR